MLAFQFLEYRGEINHSFAYDSICRLGIIKFFDVF